MRQKGLPMRREVPASGLAPLCRVFSENSTASRATHGKRLIRNHNT
ncbi:hypothetical protein [Treponema endosymbiont of Eucomonympha sp.]|nr:hypothetical protein [Treponema endosymbiont of Eucomonympha sp.]